MATLRVQNVTKEYGGQVILDDVTIDFHAGQTVGLVGPNGAGKTTLFRVIAGLVTPDIGTVTAARGLDIGYLPQEPAINPANTLLDEVAAAFDELRRLEQKQHALSQQMAEVTGDALAAVMAEYDRVHTRFLAAGGYAFEARLHEVLGGLGFSTADYHLPMSALSGGQKCRAALARLLLEDNTFLLLDEPTNHLDIDAVRWLEKFLAGHQGGAVVISHDRYLLDRIADRIVEVHRGRLHSYPGNYSNYVQARDTRRLTQSRQYEQDQAFIAKERAFIARHMGSQRTAEAKGRLTRLERRLREGEFVTQRPDETRRVKLAFPERDTTRGWVLDVRGLAKAYGDKRLFGDLDLELLPGQRLGITGPNGTGKSTLLKIVMGQVTADGGRARFGSRVQLGFFAQESNELDPEQTVFAAIQAVRGDLGETQVRSQLGRFLFTGDDAFKRIGQLSGGEQSRVRLLRLILGMPNVLVLDEPTNHLDIPAREALEDALAEFPGAVLVVSHDRYFLDRVAERLLIIRTNGHRLHNGNYSHYIAQLEAEQAAAARAAQAEIRPTPRPAPRPRSGGKRQARVPLAELEQAISQREARLSEIAALFSSADTYRDAAAVAQLREELAALQAELTELHAEWSQRVDAGEDA